MHACKTARILKKSSDKTRNPKKGLLIAMFLSWIISYVSIGIPMVKKNLMIYIEEEVIEKAKELGLNISKVCENCLKDMIRRIEGSNSSKKGANLVRGVGFEPTNPYGTAASGLRL